MPRLIPVNQLAQPRATIMYPGSMPYGGGGYGRQQYPRPAQPQQEAGPAAPPMSLAQRQADYETQSTGFKRQTSSPFFLDSVRRNNEMAGAQKRRGAAALDAKRAGILKAGGNMSLGAPAPMIPGAATQPSTPPKQVGVPGSSRGLKKFDDGSSETTLRWGTPGSAAVPDETVGQYAGAVMKQQDNASVMANRGFSTPGATFRPPTGSPAVPEQYESMTRRFKPPQGNYGLSQDQLNGIQRDADQQAYIGYQREAADIQDNGAGIDRGLVQQQAGAQADLAQANVLAQQNRAMPRIPGQAAQAKDTELGDWKGVYSEATKSKDPVLQDFAHKQIGGYAARQDQKRAATTQPSTPQGDPQLSAPAPEGHQAMSKEGFPIIKRGGVWVRADTGQPYQPS